MNRWKFISLFIISCSFLTSCHTSKRLTTETLQVSNIVFDRINSDSIYKRIEHNQDIPFLTAKGHIIFSNKDETVEGKITLYLVKDSFYLLIVKKLGIELSRILITKDSLKILDRMNESYSINSMDDLIHKYKIPIDFEGIQQLLTSGCFLDSAIFYEFKKDKKQCTLYGTSESQTLTYQLDTFRLLPLSFEAKYENHFLQVDIQKTNNFSGKWIPTKYHINISNSKTQIINTQIIWDEIKLDSILSVKFVIPEYYTKAGE